MKLFKKLLPIATIGSVAAIVAPIATSCAKNTIYTFDSNSLYLPNEKKAAADSQHPSGYNPTDAKKLYYDHIINNPNVFFQDLAAAASHLLYLGVHPISGEPHMKDFKVQQSYSNLSINKEKDLVSFTVDGQYHLEKYIISKSFTADVDLSVKVNVIDTEFQFGYDTSGGFWYFISEDFGYMNPENFKFEFTVSGSIISNYGPAYCFILDNEKMTIDKSHLPPSDSAWELIYWFFSYYIFNVSQSFHLADIKYSA